MAAWIERYVRVRRADVSTVEAILEGYEGLVSTATVDRARSVLRVQFPEAFAADVDALLRDLALRYDAVPLSAEEAAAYAETVTAPRPLSGRRRTE